MAERDITIINDTLGTIYVRVSKTGSDTQDFVEIKLKQHHVWKRTAVESAVIVKSGEKSTVEWFVEPGKDYTFPV